MRVFYGSQLDEVVHDVISDNEGRIEVWIVMTIRSVVVIIAQQGTRLDGVHVFVVEYCIDFFM